MSPLPRRALITGIRGFTGRYMAAELRTHGYEVFGLGSQPSDEPGYHQVDLLDPESVQQAVQQVRPDVVLHLAALAFVGHGNPNGFYQVHLIGTRNLLEALAASVSNLDCVLLASSANVYGNGVGGMLSEATTPLPANDYAVSKLAMEYLAALWMERLPLVIARPFNYSGVGQAENFLLPKIVSHFRRRATRIELGNLDVWRDFSDVRAVVQAYRSLIEVKPLGQTVNVCSGRTHSLGEIIDICRAVTGHSMEVAVNPAFVRPSEVKTLCGDATRLRSLIGDWDTPTLENTLRWMLAAT